MLRFRRMRSLQMFAAVHASIYNHFNQERLLSSRQIFKTNRTAALEELRLALFRLGSRIHLPTETGSNSSDTKSSTLIEDSLVGTETWRAPRGRDVG